MTARLIALVTTRSNSLRKSGDNVLKWSAKAFARSSGVTGVSYPREQLLQMLCTGTHSAVVVTITLSTEGQYHVRAAEGWLELSDHLASPF
jgi:hypothetical protein